MQAQPLALVRRDWTPPTWSVESFVPPASHAHLGERLPAFNTLFRMGLDNLHQSRVGCGLEMRLLKGSRCRNRVYSVTSSVSSLWGIFLLYDRRSRIFTSDYGSKYENFFLLFVEE